MKLLLSNLYRETWYTATDIADLNVDKNVNLDVRKNAASSVLREVFDPVDNSVMMCVDIPIISSIKSEIKAR